MTKILTLILALVVIWLDYLAYKRLKSNGTNKKILYSFCGIVLASYLLILLTPLFIFIFIDAENSQWMMKFSMSILTFYLFFSVSRIFAYAFWLPSKKKIWMKTGISAGVLLFLFFHLQRICYPHRL